MILDFQSLGHVVTGGIADHYLSMACVPDGGIWVTTWDSRTYKKAADEASLVAVPEIYANQIVDVLTVQNGINLVVTPNGDLWTQPLYGQIFKIPYGTLNLVNMCQTTHFLRREDWSEIEDPLMGHGAVWQTMCAAPNGDVYAITQASSSNGQFSPGRLWKCAAGASSWTYIPVYSDGNLIQNFGIVGMVAGKVSTDSEPEYNIYLTPRFQPVFELIGNDVWAIENSPEFCWAGGCVAPADHALYVAAIDYGDEGGGVHRYDGSSWTVPYTDQVTFINVAANGDFFVFRPQFFYEYYPDTYWPGDDILRSEDREFPHFTLLG